LVEGFRSLITNVGLAERRVQNTVWSVKFSPDGTRVASAGQDGSVWLWGVPGRSATRSPDRALLPRSSRPGWITVSEVALAFAALTLVALAIAGGKGTGVAL
jgi:WD40 repeat protein